MCVSTFPVGYQLNITHDLSQPLVYCNTLTAEEKAIIYTVPCAPIPECESGKYYHLSCRNEWDESRTKPVISSDLIITLLAHVHSFTTLSIETQASGFSRSATNQTLGLMFHLNTAHLMLYSTSRPMIQKTVIANVAGFIRIRVTRHICPTLISTKCTCWRNMYQHTPSVWLFFPRYKGLKLLAVRLTEASRREIESFEREVQALNAAKELGHVTFIPRKIRRLFHYAFQSRSPIAWKRS